MSLSTVKNRVQEDSPPTVSLQLDGWTAHHTGYMGAILGIKFQC